MKYLAYISLAVAMFVVGMIVGGLALGADMSESLALEYHNYLQEKRNYTILETGSDSHIYTEILLRNKGSDFFNWYQMRRGN